MRLSPHKVGSALAVLLGFVHLLWALTVALNLGQPLLDFIFGLHFIKVAILVQEFDIMTAIGLVATTTLSGYVMGWVFAHIWNRVGR